LRNFQEVMKEAKRRESASLPIASAPGSSDAAGTPIMPDASGKDVEQQAIHEATDRAQVCALLENFCRELWHL
jgi:hypothetical protein